MAEEKTKRDISEVRKNLTSLLLDDSLNRLVNGLRSDYEENFVVPLISYDHKVSLDLSEAERIAKEKFYGGERILVGGLYPTAYELTGSHKRLSYLNGEDGARLIFGDYVDGYAISEGDREVTNGKFDEEKRKNRRVATTRDLQGKDFEEDLREISTSPSLEFEGPIRDELLSRIFDGASRTATSELERTGFYDKWRASRNVESEHLHEQPLKRGLKDPIVRFSGFNSYSKFNEIKSWEDLIRLKEDSHNYGLNLASLIDLAERKSQELPRNKRTPIISISLTDPYLSRKIFYLSWMGDCDEMKLFEEEFDKDYFSKKLDELVSQNTNPFIRLVKKVRKSLRRNKKRS